MAVALVGLVPGVPGAQHAVGATPLLARYPYLTDLTSTSVAVSWATSSADTSPGVVTYGIGGACTTSIASAGAAAVKYTAFGETTPYYQHTVTVKNLTPATSYCYRVYTGSSAPGTALLSEPPQFPTSFTTLPVPGSSSTFSFDVLGDWGETALTNNSPLTTYNPYQAAIDSQLAASTTGTNPALFAISTGDIAYNDGSETNYGDLNHPADGSGGTARRSDVFDARYWAKVGSQLPLASTIGNHGRTGTFFTTWPTPTNVAASGGVYGTNVSYPSVDGIAAGNYPSDWYAFTVSGVRFYMLDGDWTDVSQTAYPTLGTACTNGTCPTYQIERDEHWQQTSAEYQWLKADLQQDVGTRGASALRFAIFHYPLRVDQNNFTTQQDVYLQNSAADPNGGAGSLEALLAANNVDLAFNGHAHLYERNIAPLGGIPNYVTGGGGGVPTNVSTTCSPTDAYARGWAPTAATGSSCGTPSDGSAPKPTSAAQAYSFLRVTVSGTNVTVTPTDSTGTVFDPMTYHFQADTQSPTVPGAPKAVAGTGTSAANVTLTLGTAATDNVGVVAYDIYRDGGYRASVPAGVAKWTDIAVPPGTHTWTVAARDQRGNQSAQSSPSGPVTIADTTPPTAPGAPVATTSPSAPDSVALTWAASTDNGGVASYAVYRDGSVLFSGVTGTSAQDTTVTDVTSYTYTVRAVDTAGNVSAASAPTTITTPDWTPPTAPTLAASAGPPHEIDLSWSGATDNVGVTGYDVYRDAGSTPVATGVTGTSWADTGLAAGSTHGYYVVARDAAGNTSPPSNTATATVTSTFVAVGPPTGLTATQQPTAGQVTLNWSAPTTGSASSYGVSRNGQVLASGLTGTTYTDSTAPDSAAATYTVTALDTAGNTASATVSITPDWTPPSAPGAVSATPTSSSTVTLSWSAASDAVGVTGYTVQRTDPGGATSTVMSVPSTGPLTVTDSGRTPGASYQYTVTASDAAGNVSQPGTGSVTMPVFTENFESGTFAPNIWTAPTAGLTTEQALVHSGSWAAEEVSTGAATDAVAQLPSTYPALHAAAWVYVKSRSTSAGFLKLRSATGAYIAYLYVNAGGYLSVRNDAGNVTHVSTTPVSTGAWHYVEYYLNTNPGGPITIWAAIDGTKVTFTVPVSSTETLGTHPIGQLLLGDDVAGRTYDIVIDDVRVDTSG